MFLSTDEPERVVELITAYPEFRELYGRVYQMCRDMEDVMGIFSEELRILDRNTVKYMIDELHDKLEEQAAVIADKDAKLADKDAELADKETEIAELRRLLAEQKTIAGGVRRTGGKTMYDEVQVLEHSSIRVGGEKVLYFDPFHVEGEPRDADIIFVTHEHYDHYSPEDIAKVAKKDTVLVLPESMKGQEGSAGLEQVVFLRPGERTEVLGIAVEAVAAYNEGRPFHIKSKNWLGYVAAMGGTRYFVAGDTDANAENRKVACDVAVVPVGGKFTMNAKDAAAYVNEIKPKCAIPSHYGSIVGKAEDAQVFMANVDAQISTRK